MRMQDEDDYLFRWRLIMKQKILKKITAIIMVVTCVAGMAFSTNAYNISFGASGNVGYSSGTDYYTDSAHTSVLSGVGFIGLPAGVFPSNKYVNVRIYKSKKSSSANSPAVLHYSTGAIVFDAYSAATCYTGASTNASTGATVGVYVTY